MTQRIDFQQIMNLVSNAAHRLKGRTELYENRGDQGFTVTITFPDSQVMTSPNPCQQVMQLIRRALFAPWPQVQVEQMGEKQITQGGSITWQMWLRVRPDSMLPQGF